MRPQAYQVPELRDENDVIIQTGTFGKKTAFVNQTNDGILDYLFNNMEALKSMSAGAIISVDSLPETGDKGKFYLSKADGKMYMYSDSGEWVQVTTQAQGISAYQVAKNNGYTGTEEEWLVYIKGEYITDITTDDNGYMTVVTNKDAHIKTALQPLVNAKKSADAAKISESNAAASESNAKASADKALASEKNAKTSETAAKASQTASKTSETNSKASETAAADSAGLAKRWAISEEKVGTDDNGYSSYYWASKSKASASASETSAGNSKTSETNAASSASAANASAQAAASSASAAAESEEKAKTFDPKLYATLEKVLAIEKSVNELANKSTSLESDIMFEKDSDGYVVLKE